MNRINASQLALIEYIFLQWIIQLQMKQLTVLVANNCLRLFIVKVFLTLLLVFFFFFTGKWVKSSTCPLGNCSVRGLSFLINILVNVGREFFENLKGGNHVWGYWRDTLSIY